MPDYRTPGVYIEEIPATGPIAGVGTSTAAFLGPTLDGPIASPVKVNNWTQFKTVFGEYSSAPTLYVPHAVRGFFENGGTSAWVVRVGTGRRAAIELDDRGAPAGKALRIEAKRMGSDGNRIRVEVKESQIVTATAKVVARKGRAAIKTGSGNIVTLQVPADASKFQPGDIAIVESTGERLQVLRVVGSDVQLVTPLSGTVGATDFLRIADLAPGQKSFRLDKVAGLEAGSAITVAQGATKEVRVIDAVAGEMITLGGGLTNSYKLGAADPDVTIVSEEFLLTVAKPGVPPVAEEFAQLSMDPRHSRYFRKAVNSKLIDVSPSSTPSTELPPNNRPALGAKDLAGGIDDSPGRVSAGDYQAALDALTKIDDVSLVCAPGLTESAVQSKLIDHCERLADRFAILDSPRGAPPLGVGSVLEQRAGLTSAGGYAAVYYPWITVLDPASRANETMLAPPSGHLAGIFARSDSQRGVQKAPANEIIAGVVGLERILDDRDQADLNHEGVNVLRSFSGQRPVVWGARTTAPLENTQYRYVNVRRLLLFIEESIQEGIRWAVFEPNELSLWKKLERTISEFLNRVWRSGALFGKTAAEAFYVKIDEELNPPFTRALGQVIIEVGVAPVRPAEFVIVRIALWEGGAQANER